MKSPKLDRRSSPAQGLRVSQPRSTLTATQLEELYENLDRQLDDAGIESQPEVAAQILEIISDPDAGMKDFADIIKTDPGLSARLLRLANSAYFAQRDPVTQLERACVILGLSRLRAVSLGFSLGRASSDPTSEIARRVWGASLFRACLATKVAERACPGLAAEAFVIGLMADCGMALTHLLLGDRYEEIICDPHPPATTFDREFKELEYTHVDVAVVLMRRWNIPDLIAKPISWHHTLPSSSDSKDPVHALHRVAFYVGQVGLNSDGLPNDSLPCLRIADAALGLNADALKPIISSAVTEYQATFELFNSFADRVGDLAALSSKVHDRLVEVVDDSLMRDLADKSSPFASFLLAGRQVEIESDSTKQATAYLRDERGQRIVSYQFAPGVGCERVLLEAFGLEPECDDEVGQLRTYLQRIAA